MGWIDDHLAPVETLLFRSGLVKAGCFRCDSTHPCFPLTEPLDNDIFVFPCNAVWIRRRSEDFRFVEPGGILLHRAGSAIERPRVDGAAEHTYWFAVRPDLFVESLQRHKLPTDNMGGALIAMPRLRFRISSLVYQLESCNVGPLAAEEEVLTLFSKICRQRSAQPRRALRGRLRTRMRRRRLVDAAREYLNEHLTENIGLQQVALAVGASHFHLCRVFREQTGLTLHSYRNRQRLGRAVDRMAKGNVTDFSELAHDLGFSSHSHLSRLFHQQMGVPPSLLRAGANPAIPLDRGEI